MNPFKNSEIKVGGASSPSPLCLFLSSPRHNQDCFTRHEQRKQGTVSSGHPGQRHGRPDGRTIRDHYCKHHAD